MFKIPFSIDASIKDGTLGRLVNDDPKPNSKMKLIAVDEVPHLCLFAVMDIKCGDEITYDYSRGNLPWRLSDAKDISKVKCVWMCLWLSVHMHEAYVFDQIIIWLN